MTATARPWAAKAPLSQRTDAWLVTALSFAWLVATAWCRPLLLPDEGRYVGVAWEMLRSGDWLTPTLNGLPFFHKPPLFYWLTAAAMAVFGPGEWSARTASVAGATLGAVALYLFVRHWQGRRAARTTLVVLLVQPLWFIGGQFANLDMLVAGCIVACTLALAHAALQVEAGRPATRALLLAHALAGLGVLAKGLIGVVLPGLIVLAWLVLRQRWRLLPALLSLRGVLVLAVITVPWFWLMAQRFDGFLHYFFVVQHFQRFAGGGFNNAQPFWFYPAVLGLFSLPWLLWLRAPVNPADAATESAHDLGLLMLTALAVVLVFFSLPQSKLIGYILPCVPPLAWWVARHAPAADAPYRRRRLWWATVLLTCAISAAAITALSLDRRHSSRALAQALAGLRHGDEPVLMLGQYGYDVPFYARLKAPVPVADAWDDPAVRRRDTWRKELADAGSFAPASASSLLIAPAAAPAALCTMPVGWVISRTPRAGGFVPPAWLQGAAPAYQGQGSTLWRVDTRSAAMAQACGQTPSAALPAR